MLNVRGYGRAGAAGPHRRPLELATVRLGFPVAAVRAPPTLLASFERRGMRVAGGLNDAIIGTRLQPFALSWMIREHLGCRDGFRVLRLSDLDIGPALAHPA